MIPAKMDPPIEMRGMAIFPRGVQEWERQSGRDEEEGEEALRGSNKLRRPLFNLCLVELLSPVYLQVGDEPQSKKRKLKS